MQLIPLRYMLLMMMGSLVANLSLAQSCKRQFKAKLDHEGKVKDCSINHTIERLPSGQYVYKRYDLPSKVITHRVTFRDKTLKTKEGLYFEKWDDGTVVHKGIYKADQKHGLWVENETQHGNYNRDKREGVWKRYSRDSMLISSTTYRDGLRHGPEQTYDSTGVLIKEILFENDEALETSVDTTEEVVETFPIFGKCRDAGMSDIERKECSERALIRYVYTNLKYPKAARELGVQGSAIIRFVVGKDGSVRDIVVLRGVSPEIKNEVYKLVASMPDWLPGTQRGVPVNVLYTLPVTFKLE